MRKIILLCTVLACFCLTLGNAQAKVEMQTGPHGEQFAVILNNGSYAEVCEVVTKSQFPNPAAVACWDMYHSANNLPSWRAYWMLSESERNSLNRSFNVGDVVWLPAPVVFAPVDRPKPLTTEGPTIPVEELATAQANLDDKVENLEVGQVELSGNVEQVKNAQEELARKLAEEQAARKVLETALATHVTLVAVQTTQLGEITTQLETAQADLHKLQQAVTELRALLRFAAIGFVLAFVALVSVLALSGRQQRKRERELEERIAALEPQRQSVSVVP